MKDFFGNELNVDELKDRVKKLNEEIESFVCELEDERHGGNLW